tara:strand:+ start:103 stop:465 length:363 start_codon:yes stop_codon:yes gene_type:complete
VKQFHTFITEARVTKASSQAKRLGLVGDGHGDWYDKQGNLKAKTISGELKMFTGRERQDDVAVDKPAAQGTIAPRSSFAKDIVSNLGLTPPATVKMEVVQVLELELKHHLLYHKRKLLVL